MRYWCATKSSNVMYWRCVSEQEIRFMLLVQERKSMNVRYGWGRSTRCREISHPIVSTMRVPECPMHSCSAVHLMIACRQLVSGGTTTLIGGSNDGAKAHKCDLKEYRALLSAWGYLLDYMKSCDVWLWPNSPQNDATRVQHTNVVLLGRRWTAWWGKGIVLVKYIVNTNLIEMMQTHRCLIDLKGACSVWAKPNLNTWLRDVLELEQDVSIARLSRQHGEYRVSVYAEEQVMEPGRYHIEVSYR